MFPGVVYLVDYEACRLCHGEALTGGTNPVTPPGPSLRVVKGWTADQFVSTMRTGKDPTGHVLSNLMPSQDIARLDDVELQAVYAYLSGLGAAQ